jgi:Right handed beta helix region
MPSPPPTPLSSPGIFNVLDPWYNDPSAGWTGMVAGSSGNPVTNAAVLNQIIKLARTTDCAKAPPPYGAIILFPGHSDVPSQESTGEDNGAEYFIAMPGDGSAAITAVACNWPLRFLGTGNVKLTVVFADGGGTTPGDFFALETDEALDNTGGLLFEDLTFGYTQTTSAVPIAALHSINTQNLRVNRCVFNDCPIAVWFEHALQGEVSYCTIQWQNNNGIGIKFGNGDQTGDSSSANDCHVSHTVMNGQGAPVPCTGVLLEGSDHARMDNCLIFGVFNGILIRPGPVSTANNATNHTFSNLNIQIVPDEIGAIGNAVLIQPQATKIKVGQITFTSCSFELADGAAPELPGPGIIIDATQDVIDGVRFVSCSSTRWPGPGIYITSESTATPPTVPSNIEIIGGLYAGNQYPGVPGEESYGIYVGPSSGVRIVGADCVGEYTYITNVGGSTSYQQAVGIYVDGGAENIIIDACDVTLNNTNGIQVNGSSSAVTNIFVRNCNATGYSSYNTAIKVHGTASNLASVQITDCGGYNDAAAGLTVTVPGTPFSARTFGYYGPATFYASGSSSLTLTIAGQSTGGISNGTFFLPLGHSASYTIIGGGHGWSAFSMIGQ